MKKIISFSIILVALLVTAAACAPAPKEITPFESVCTTPNNGQVVTTSGYFTLGASMYCSDTSGYYRCGLDFRAEPGGLGKFSVDVKVGKGKNQMQEMPSNYSESDLIITTSDGKTIGVMDQVVITGKLGYNEDSDVCYMYVDRIDLAAGN